MRRGLAVLGLLLLAACAKKKEPPKSAASALKESSEVGNVHSEARRLSSEVRDLADRLADYIGSHRGKPPKRLADLAIDSLTPETARTLAIADSPRVVVAYRREQGRQIVSCVGGPALIEEAQLNGGLFHLACRTPMGDTTIAAQELP